MQRELFHFLCIILPVTTISQFFTSFATITINTTTTPSVVTQDLASQKVDNFVSILGWNEIKHL